MTGRQRGSKPRRGISSVCAFCTERHSVRSAPFPCRRIRLLETQLRLAMRLGAEVDSLRERVVALEQRQDPRKYNRGLIR